MSKFDWKLFKEELPEKGRYILYGNHRWVEPLIYHPEHEHITTGKLVYKDITHWCYLETPPPVEFESKWNR
jgi:hypothetical protein